MQFIYINRRALRYKHTPKKRQAQTWLNLIEDQELEMEDGNLHQQEGGDNIANENDTILYDSDETTNTRPVIAGGNWYEDGNDEDLQKLDKAVELTKIISLKAPGFLDVVT